MTKKIATTYLFFCFQTLTALSVDNSFLGFALKSLQNKTTPQKLSMAFVHGKLSEFKVSEPIF